MRDLEYSRISEEPKKNQITAKYQHKTDYRDSYEYKNAEYERNNETETVLLKGLWKERDQEIKKMDDLFESINRKLEEVQ